MDLTLAGGFGMRESLIRQLRRVPVIAKLYDEYERMQAARDVALAERNEALADRTAALAERDAAVAERQSILGDNYFQMLFGRGAAIRDFRTPTQLALTPTPVKRLLVIGSCFAYEISRAAPFAIPGCEADYLLYNNVGELPQDPPRPISDYDFQVIILSRRSIMPEQQYMRIDYADISAYESVFNNAIARLHQMLDGALAYSQRFGKLTFIVNFLVPQQNPLGRLLPKSDLRNPAYFCEQLNAEIENTANSLRDVHVIDMDNISAAFGKRWIQDDFLWAFGHGTFMSDYDTLYDGDRLEPVLPISQQLPFLVGEFFGATWQEIASVYRTLRQVDPVKMVVIDLDDTLWRGVAADEQSLDWLRMVDGWPLGFMEALQYVRKRGILLAIISRNEQQLIENVWPQLCGGLIELDDFASIKINWRPKTENMEDLLAEVNLLPRNVLFIDDNPVERAAMTAAFPEMRVLGANPHELRRLLLWAPETQVAFITDESNRRTEMVKAQVERERRRQRVPRSEFLATLGLTFRLIRLASTDDPQFPRAFELLNKTNQFNTTGKRWAMEEILQSLTAGTEIYAFEIADTYTRYGLVGVVIMNGSTFEQFAMSCRVAGLDVEMAAISLLARHVAVNRTGHIRAVTRDTDANLLSRDAWRRCGFEWKNDHWEAVVSDIVSVPAHIEILGEPALSRDNSPDRVKGLAGAK
jgi:FkbH-like protein